MLNRNYKNRFLASTRRVQNSFMTCLHIIWAGPEKAQDPMPQENASVLCCCCCVHHLAAEIGIQPCLLQPPLNWFIIFPSCMMTSRTIRPYGAVVIPRG